MTTTNKNRFAIHLGKLVHGKFITSFHAGDAFEEGGHYAVKLFALPCFYFLRKNKDADAEYTLYAKRLGYPESTRFLDPVGKGVLDDTLKTHMMIELPFFERRLFMSLYPSN